MTAHVHHPISSDHPPPAGSRFAESPIFAGLGTALQRADFAWSLGLIGEDHANKLTMLAGDLRRRPSATGDGKRIISGLSYSAAASAISWANACKDHLYPVMRQSIESFEMRWADIRPALGTDQFQYVSLGPGDGQKDSVILSDLARSNPGLCYVPIDVSPELLRVCQQAVRRQARLPLGRVMPLQVDFSAPDNLAELRRLLDELFGEQPRLVSLLGNTLANFDDDAGLLRTLAGQLLRPQDRFVLELATAEHLGTAQVEEAGAEYERSRPFREFVTSALMCHTDLRVDMDSVQVSSALEDDRGVLVKVIYRNRTGEPVRMTLPDRTEVSFEPDDTIRIYLSRKYLRAAGIPALLTDAGLERLADTHSNLVSAGGSRQFGMELLVLSPGQVSTRLPVATVASALWR